MSRGRKMIDLTNRQFGRLRVIGRANNNPYYVVCECKCGKTVTVRAGSLTQKHNPTRSCGCIQREFASEIGKKNIAENSRKMLEMNRKYNTNFSIIESKTSSSNTGHRGIYKTKSGKFMAHITLHYKTYRLGTFDKIDEAIQARIDAEHKLFDPIIAEKNALIANI